MLTAKSLRLIAHRGASAERPENTILAFARALELGCKAIELDVRLSADGVPMVVHDADLMRTHGRDEVVSLSGARQLAGLGVPTLEEVLLLCQGRAELCIELKGDDPALSEAVLELLPAFSDWRILSFSSAILEPFSKAGFRENCVLNMTEPRQANWPVLSCAIETVDSQFVKEAQSRGIKVWAFTCNTIDSIQRAVDLNLDAVFSDYGQVSAMINIEAKNKMQRNYSGLRSGPFDLLIIGGGIYGAWAAYDAALRGLKVAIVDQGDWACGTSQSSSKLVHGGLRYLEHFDFGLVRKAIAERRKLSRLGPHRIRPLRFIIPNYKGDRVSPFKFRLGLMIYDWFAGRAQPGARHRQISSKETIQRWPFLRRKGLRAAFSYCDCETDDARLVLELISGALSAGAVAVNYARVEHLIRETQSGQSRVTGAKVVDSFGDEQAIDIHAKIVFAPVGPWVDTLRKPTSKSECVRLIQGTHLVMPALPCQQAFLLTADDGRIFFLIPWYGRTLLGTTEIDHHGHPRKARVSENEIEYLIQNANASFHNLSWNKEDVISSFVGLRTLPNQTGSASAVSREWELTEPEPGLLLPIGGKLTSARVDAAEVVDLVVQRLGRKAVECKTDDRPFPWRPAGDWPSFVHQCLLESEAVGLDAECAATAAHRYGSRFGMFLELIRETPELAERIHPDLPFSKAEVVFARDYEMACADKDIFRRRLPLWLLEKSRR